MNIKKISLIMILILIIIAFGATIFLVPSSETVLSKSDSLKNVKTLNVVTTNFATYDFVRAIALNQLKKFDCKKYKKINAINIIIIHNTFFILDPFFCLPFILPYFFHFFKEL